MFKVYILHVLLLLGIVANAQELTIKGEPVIPQNSASLQQQFDHFEVFRIDLANLNRAIIKEESVIPVHFQFGNQFDWQVRLIPNDIRGEDYQLNVAASDGGFEQSRSRNKTFVGHVLGDQGGSVRLTIDRDFIYGFFRFAGEAYFVEPLKQFVKEAPADQFIFYKASDVNPVEGQKCAVNEIKSGLGKEVQQEQADLEKAVGLCYNVEIALAADFSMFNQFGSVTATENQVLGILNLVQTNYDDEFDDEIVFQVVTVFVSSCSTCDPWTSSTDAGTLLTSFADWGNGGGFGLNFDVATLWTNRDFIGDTIGVAWPGTVCTSQKYNTCQNFSFNASLLRVLQAHELGHNFNAGHDNPGSITIMAPAVNNTNTWSSTSQAVISNYIASLGTGSSCFTTCAPALPPVAAIFAPVNNVCPGSVVPFFDNSSNNPTSWSWNFPGGTPSSSNQQNPTVVYQLPGSYPVILTVTNSSGVDATNLSFDINVTDAGTKYIVYETFELGPANFFIENPDGAITWEITNVGGTQSGNRAIYVNNFDYNAAGQKDALVSMPFDFSTESNITMEMDYAYRRYDASLKDKLRILISTNGGATFPFTAFEGDETGSGNFATAPDSESAFTPAVQNDWCYGTDFGADCISIDLSTLTGEPNVVIKIENETGFGNNLYIDNLQITSSCQPIIPPVAAFTANIQQGCIPLEVNFESQSTGLITNYNWSFPGGNPTFSTDPNPTVTYNFPGIYDVILLAGNGAGTSTAEEFGYIEVQGPPSVGFNYEVEDLTVLFDNQTVSGVSSLWDFGDGNTSNVFNPNHTYAETGEYTVILSVTNACGTDSFEETIIVNSPLTAAFSASETSGCADLEITFTDESVGNIDSWEWTFPGGNPSNSTAQSPTVTYTQAGTYTVTLTISNGLNQTTVEEIDYIAIEDVPNAAFTINSTLGEANASFTNQSINADSYSWDFGDGTTSTATSPSHTYQADGTYDVQLIAINPCGTDTALQQLTILNPPMAGFTVNETSGCAPFEVSFSGQPIGDGLTYAWEFEGANPTTSTAANPTVTYENAGTFSVSLTVSNAAGLDTYEETNLIQVDSLPTADFAIATTLGESIANFDNTSENATGYSWDFGDGTTSAATSPSHTYPADGTYDVQLIAINPCGNDTALQQLTILSPPVAGFTVNETSGCAPFEVSFSGQPIGDGLTYAWEFEGANPTTSTAANPTVTYENAGTFSVSLTVNNAAGSDTYEETNLIEVDSLPTADFAIATTLGESTANFDNTSENATGYSWDFGDGTTSAATSPSHTYQADGTYNVQLIAINPCGNDTTLLQLTILSPPVASFTANETSGCAPFEVSFSGQPIGEGLTYAWEFAGANPSISAATNPTVTYENAGTFSVSLTVSNAAGSDTYEETNLIEVDSLPTADFAIATTLGESTANFDNTSENATGYSWDFGDGTTSAATSPSHTYQADGTYNVQLIAINPCGNDTTLLQLTILSPPVASFTANETSGCAPFEVSFSGQPIGEGLTYAWEFESANPSTSAAANPTVTYENAGTFSVSLTVSNAAGSETYEEMDLIEVGTGPTAGFEIEYNLGENTAAFVNTSTSAQNYSWDFGDGETSIAENPSHEFVMDGTYEIALIVENECGTDTLSKEITVITPPKADFLANQTNGCAPHEVQFMGQTPGPGATFTWTFTGGTPTTSSLQNPTIVYDSAGSYGVQLVVSNAAGLDTALIDNFIVVEDLPVALFSSLVNGFTVQFNNNSQAGSSFEWDFGDGSGSDETSPTHVFQTEGIFIVTLTVTNACGSRTTSEQVEINVDFPTADFTASVVSGCAPLTVQFTSLAENADSLAWSFPGGVPATSNDPNPVVTFNNPGVYDVTLAALNSFGNATAVEVDLISIGTAPIAGFEFAISETTVVFTNNSEGAISYSWDFGDGAISSDAEPVHIFPAAGTFLVQLIATNNCGNDTLSQEVTIEGMAPVPAIEADTNRGCLPLTIQFMDQSTGSPTTWLWNFAGAEPATATVPNPMVTYEQSGTFEVSLMVSNAFGSNTTAFLNFITVLDNPEADFDFEIDNLDVTFNALTTGDGLTYEWSFGDGISSELANPVHSYETPGLYDVSLIVSNECGADTISREIELIVDNLITPKWVSQFDLFPNPNNGQFSLLLRGAPKPELRMQLINVIGQVLYQEELDFATGYLQKDFDFSLLPAGMYLVQLQSGKQFDYKKVILE